MTFVVPANLLDSAREDDSGRLRQWVDGLPDTVRQVADLWSLHVGAPYQPGGVCSWVAPVHGPAGGECVLKVGWRHEEGLHEADGLRFWAGEGAVVLHDAARLGQTDALLLERCDPGTSLSDTVPEPEQDNVVADLLRRLWVAPPDGHPFRPLQVLCDRWVEEFDEELASAPGTLDPGLARVASQLLHGLPASACREVLLCTDLHAGNVLAARREPWLMIDPKPYVGDPTYDALQHLLNCPERLSADPAALVRRLADLLDLDADRLALWLFARCLLESVEQPWLRDVAASLAPA